MRVYRQMYPNEVSTADSKISIGRRNNCSGACISRREFIWGGVSAIAAPFVGACLGGPAEIDLSDANARLNARPRTPTETPVLGLSELGLGGGRDGLMYVPEGYSPDTAFPLFVGLHGAGGDADDWNGSYPNRAEHRGMVFVAPDSRDDTWDRIMGHYGPDVEFLDAVLNYTFTRCRIDPSRIALAGFSDGASYALSLGAGNGDLFTHLVAYSPGMFRPPRPTVGKPMVFISHGLNDNTLTFNNTADNIVVGLTSEDYDVTFHEFDGGHEVPSEISDAALNWFLDVPS